MSSSLVEPRNSRSWYSSLLAEPDSAARIGIQLVVMLSTAWSLGPRDFGVLQAALALAALISAAVSLGLDPAVRHQLRNLPYMTDSTLGTAMALRCGLGVIAYVVLLCCTSKGQATPQSVWLVTGLMVLMQTPLLLGLRLEEAGHKARARFARNVGFVFSALLVMAMVWRSADTVWFACAIVLEQPLVALLMLYSHGRVAPEEEKFTWDSALARSWLLECRKTWANAILPLIVLPVSLLVLIAVSTSSQAGVFGVAILLFESAAFLGGAALTEFRARNASVDEKGSESDSKMLDEALTRGATVGWITAATVSAASVVLGSTLLRQSFPSLSWVGPTLGMSLVPLAIGRIREGRFDPLSNRRKRNHRLTAVINVILATLLAPRFGAAGAAMSFLVGSVVSELVLPYFILAERKLARSQGKALILWSLWHGEKKAAPSPAPSMIPESKLCPDTQEAAASAPLRLRKPLSAESLDAIPPSGAVAKSS